MSIVSVRRISQAFFLLLFTFLVVATTSGDRWWQLRGWPVNLLAQLYGLCAIVNMSWPRSPADPWYSNYGVLLTSLGVIGLGLLYMLLWRPYDRGRAPAGDAHQVMVAVGAPISD